MRALPWRLTSLCAGLGLAACASAPLPPAAPDPDPVPDAVAARGWLLPTGDAAATRHSPLAQITPANVGRLQPAWRFATGAARGQEGGPLVVGRTMYLHTPFPNTVTALDLAERRVLWTYTPLQDPEVVSLMCCDVVSRGLAYGRGKVFLISALILGGCCSGSPCRPGSG